MPQVRTYIVTQTTEVTIRHGYEGDGPERQEQALREAHRFMLNPTPSMTSAVVKHRIVEESISELTDLEAVRPR